MARLTDSTFAIYRTGAEPRIGLNIQGTSDLTVSELHALIDALDSIARRAAMPDLYTSADHGHILSEPSA